MLLVCLQGFSQEVVQFADAVFKHCCVVNGDINTNGDDEIQISEARAFTGNVSCINANISDLRGLEEFINIDEVNFWGNALTFVDLTANTQLTKVTFTDNQISQIILNNNPLIEDLYLDANQIESIDLSALENLDLLWLYNN